MERLESYERYRNVCNSDELQIPSANPVLFWPEIVFQSVTQEHGEILPKVTVQSIEQYRLHRQSNDCQENLGNISFCITLESSQSAKKHEAPESWCKCLGSNFSLQISDLKMQQCPAPDNHE